jgi:hypothetical protein
VSGHDDEFEDFLARRKPLFGRAPDDVLEPPEEVDRLVLRQAREAIEARRAPRAIRGAQWGTPLAVAATLLVALTVILHDALPRMKPVPDVSVQQISQQVEYPASVSAPPPAAPAARTPAAAPAAESGAVVVDLVPSPAPADEARRAKSEAAPTAAWRRDSKSWLAHIERLRAGGKTAEADAEMDEYKRQHRAYAVGPGR